VGRAQRERRVQHLPRERGRRAGARRGRRLRRPRGRPGGAAIRGRPAALGGRDKGEALTNWLFRDVELFYVRYVPIRGCSRFGYDDVYSTPRAAPERFRRPYDAQGLPRGGWADRPDHDAWYPEIAVPLELHPTFDVPAGAVQQVWVDVYVPRTAAPGAYDGTLTVRERDGAAREVRVRLVVRDFALPDRPRTAPWCR
jgi:hypothetical protein